MRAGAPSEAEALETFILESKAKLYAAREQRVHPARDEKVLTAWNGLMLRAFAEAAVAFDSSDYRDAAVRSAEFLLTQMRPSSRLLRTWKRVVGGAEGQGVARLNGYLEDYACLIDGLIATHGATFDPRYLRAAVDLADEMIDLFWDGGVHGFFDTGRDHETLITRPRDFFDNATPSGTSVAVDVLLKLALLTDNDDYERHATTCLRTLAPYVENAPTAFGRLLAALDFHLSTPQELAIVLPAPDHDSRGSTSPGRTGTQTSGRIGGKSVRGERVEPRDLLDAVRGVYAPNLLLVSGPAGKVDNPTPLLDDREALGGRPTAYLCERYVCQAPTTDPVELREQLQTALSPQP